MDRRLALYKSHGGAKESQFGGDLIPVGCRQGKYLEDQDVGAGR